jgi:hypothetical protein
VWPPHRAPQLRCFRRPVPRLRRVQQYHRQGFPRRSCFRRGREVQRASCRRIAREAEVESPRLLPPPTTVLRPGCGKPRSAFEISLLLNEPQVLACGVRTAEAKVRTDLIERGGHPFAALPRLDKSEDFGLTVRERRRCGWRAHTVSFYSMRHDRVFCMLRRDHSRKVRLRAAFRGVRRRVGDIPR